MRNDLKNFYTSKILKTNHQVKNPLLCDLKNSKVKDIVANVTADEQVSVLFHINHTIEIGVHISMEKGKKPDKKTYKNRHMLHKQIFLPILWYH